MRALGEEFRARCAVLGAEKHYAHFESWLWAARADTMPSPRTHGSGDDSGGGGGGAAVPVIPRASGAVACAELIAKLARSGLSAVDAKAVCDALDGHCTRLRRDLKAAERQRPTPRG